MLLIGYQLIIFTIGKTFLEAHFEFNWLSSILKEDLTAQKMMFPIKDFFSKCDQIQFSADLITFTEEILKGKLHFLCQTIDQCLLFETFGIVNINFR